MDFQNHVYSTISKHSRVEGMQNKSTMWLRIIMTFCELFHQKSVSLYKIREFFKCLESIQYFTDKCFHLIE